MLFSTLVSYFAGLGLLAFKGKKIRHFCLIAPITIDLLLLAFFKYSNFFCDNIGMMASLFHQSIDLPYLKIILPVGLSFYIFHTISYIVDSYRGVITPTKNFLEFACYVSLFSQLVCGPIVRFWQIENDLKNIDKPQDANRQRLGWSFFALGMIEKVLIADTIALIITPALQNYASLNTISAWICIFAFMYQILFDFSGYSDMAVGLGHLFNISIPQNFNSPYKARNNMDFFRRWHISLTTCLRDFVYQPLGGNRGGPLRTFCNGMITLFICGLWHGANWTYIFCFLYAGILIALQQVFKKQWQMLSAPLQIFAQFVLTTIGFTFFRATDLQMAFSLFKTMFCWRITPAFQGEALLLIVMLPAIWLAHIAPNPYEIDHQWKLPAALIIIGLFIVSIYFIYIGQPSPFLYFQF